MSFIRFKPLTPEEYPPFKGVLERFGFIPNALQAQTVRKDLLEGQMPLTRAAMTVEGALERRQKEYIFLAVSARNLSTYCVTAHCEIVRMLKLEGPEPEQIAIDHTLTKIPLRDKALINFAIKLSEAPTEIGEADIATLRTFGFSDRHILEAIVMTAFARQANLVAFGLGTVPDFHNERIIDTLERPAAPQPR